jgi:hypothetical protein
MHQTGRLLTRRGSGRSVVCPFSLLLPYKPYPYEGPGLSGGGSEKTSPVGSLVNRGQGAASRVLSRRALYMT